MMMGRSHQIVNIIIGDNILDKSAILQIIGSTVMEQGIQEEETKNRFAKYSQNVGWIYRILKDRNVPKKAKQIIHQTIF